MLPSLAQPCRSRLFRQFSFYCLPRIESDSQTLWFHRGPAVGTPGANGWKAEWAADLEGIDRLYFVVEDEAADNSRTLMKFLHRKAARVPEGGIRRLRGRAQQHSGYASLHDPVHNEWRDFPTKDCLPSFVAEAGARRKGGAA